MTRRFSADAQVKHLCLILPFTVCASCSFWLECQKRGCEYGESECVKNSSAHQTGLGGGDSTAVASSPGDRQSAGLESRRNVLVPDV